MNCLRVNTLNCCCSSKPCKEENSLHGLDGLGEIVMSKPEITYNTNRIYSNGKKAPDGIELRFGTARPTESARTLLKRHGFQFSEKQRIWYALDNELSRELIEYIHNHDLETDTTQYEKKYILKKIISPEQYQTLAPYTRFVTSVGEDRNYFYNKKHLEKAVNIGFLIQEGKLYYQKFYNKVIGEEGEPEESEEEKEESEVEEEQEENDAEEENDDDEEKTSEKQEKEGLPESKQQESVSIAERLKKLADGMQKSIEAKLNSATSRQRPTARRMRIAAGMRSDGYRLKNIQQALYALSAAHENGKIRNFPMLSQLKNKSDLALFNRYNNEFGKKEDDNYLTNVFSHNKDFFLSKGISSVFNWSLAYGQLQELIHSNTGTSSSFQDEEQEKIKLKEREIWNTKIPGFFPTPPELIQRALELAEIRSTDKVLEPSAGKGDILEAIRKEYGKSLNLSACEIHFTLREILKWKGFKIVGDDFLKYQGQYDKIVMNPPFENGQDIDHVLHAYSLLNKGGRLVAIMSEGFIFRKFKKEEQFREFLSQKNAFISEPLQEAFKNAFHSTGIRVRIVMMEKAETTNQGSNSDLPDLSEQEKLELEAKAKIEILKMKLLIAKKKRGLEGIDSNSEIKLQELRLKAMQLKGIPELGDLT